MRYPDAKFVHFALVALLAAQGSVAHLLHSPACHSHLHGAAQHGCVQDHDHDHGHVHGHVHKRAADSDRPAIQAVGEDHLASCLGCQILSRHLLTSANPDGCRTVLAVDLAKPVRPLSPSSSLLETPRARAPPVAS